MEPAGPTALATESSTTGSDVGFELSAAQIRYFDTFGYLRLEGLFAGDIAAIDAAFEEVFADDSVERHVTHVDLHLNEQRTIIMQIIDRHPVLGQLRDDPRLVSIMTTLIGEDYEFAESDASLFDCESSWHADTYGAPLDRLHVKASFYLDELDADSGAIRVIPGTSHYLSPFARKVRSYTNKVGEISEHIGVEPSEVPSWPVASSPGDILLWNYRTVHASWHGGHRRRLMSISFREPERTASS